MNLKAEGLRNILGTCLVDGTTFLLLEDVPGFISFQNYLSSSPTNTKQKQEELLSILSNIVLFLVSEVLGATEVYWPIELQDVLFHPSNQQFKLAIPIKWLQDSDSGKFSFEMMLKTLEDLKERVTSNQN